jgi:hypothetical protein
LHGIPLVIIQVNFKSFHKIITDLIPLPENGHSGGISPNYMDDSEIYILVSTIDARVCDKTNLTKQEISSIHFIVWKSPDDMVSISPLWGKQPEKSLKSFPLSKFSSFCREI